MLDDTVPAAGERLLTLMGENADALAIKVTAIIATVGTFIEIYLLDLW